MAEEMNKKIIIIFTLIITQSLYSYEITPDSIYRHIKILASEEFAGRKPGEKGGKLAAEYIRNQFKEIGFTPLVDNYFQHFDVVTEVKASDNNKLRFNNFIGKLKEDYIPISFSANAALKSEVVFVGYGFDIDKKDFKWNDYENIDVKGKWVMLLLGEPEMDKSDSKYADFGTTRTKVITAQDKGAAGILFVAGVNLNKKDELLSLTFDKSESRTEIPVINIRRSIANKILSEKGINIEELEKNLNKNERPESLETGTILYAYTEVFLTKAKTSNVIGMIPGHSNEYIVIGAHYDHLGMGGHGSGSRKPDTIAVHHGADDNASGVAGVIELAKKISANRKKLKTNIIFIAFSAEEMGLLGSMYFVSNPVVDLKKVRAMFNFDMLGRLKSDNTILAGGTGTSEESDSLLDLHLSGRKLKLAKSREGLGPSDHSSFYLNNIPVFFFSTGAHEDYHKPEDDIDKIDLKGEKLILDYIYELVFDIASSDKKLTFTEAGPKKRSIKGRYKVTLGFMPDFASTEKPGVGVGGVTQGSPAEMAGMKKGDRIIAIDGKTVKDIYEYMTRLNQLEPGQVITVDVIRDGEKVVLLIQL
jgi:aminopeptidase YwaD